MGISSNSPSVLLIRSSDDNQALSAVLERHGFRTFQMPFLKIAPLSFDKSFLLKHLPHTDALIITSRHVITQHIDFWQSYAPDFAHLPVYSVGQKTADAVRPFLPHIVTVQDNAEKLYPLITTKSSPLFLSGEDYTADFIDKKGCSALRIPVYKAEKESAFSHEVIQAFKTQGIDIILFYSTQTAQNFEQVLKQTFQQTSSTITRSVHSVCISSKVAQSLTLPWKSRYTAPADHMVSFLVDRFIKGC